MSTKTINDKIKAAAVSSANCHCTNGVSLDDTVVSRISKISGEKRAIISWTIVNGESTKIIMTTPIGSVNIFYVKNDLTPEQMDTEFLEIFKAQHKHWEAEE